MPPSAEVILTLKPEGSPRREVASQSVRRHPEAGGEILLRIDSGQKEI